MRSVPSLATLAALAALTACVEQPFGAGSSGSSAGRPVPVDSGTRSDSELASRLGDWEETLHLRAACDDLSLFLWNESEELGLEIVNPGLLERAAGGDLRETLELGADEVDARIVWATPISANYCAPGGDEEAREVHETWRATEGSVVVQVDQADSERPSFSLDLWNVLFVSDDGLELLKAHLEINGVEALD